MKQRSIARINRATKSHWVGDGFPVTTLLSYDMDDADISPFLLLDYAGPAHFEPSHQPRGVGQHPHRGFETVTIVYQGEVEHRDNAGNSGKIGPGDVQWMTAARGIVHEEMHGQRFTQTGGTLEMIQLWVNLPAKDKMSAPRYQAILSSDIPVVNLPEDAGHLRLIAGAFHEQLGAAKTFTPVNLWDVKLKSGHTVNLPVPEAHHISLLVLSGKVLISATQALGPRELAIFKRDGDSIVLETKEDSTILVMSGVPIDEPIVGYGPFVMNTEEEIRTAMSDYAAGRF